MKITFAPSFFESLKKMRYQNTWYIKTLDFFRYGIKNFFRNVYIFRNELYVFQPWEYSFNLRLLRKSLEKTANYLEECGYEEDISRDKKVKKIKRAIELLTNEVNGNHIDQAEKILGMEVGPLIFNRDGMIDLTDDEDDKKIFELSRKLEHDQWEELFQILKGQDTNDQPEKKYEDWFDGSDMRLWWD